MTSLYLILTALFIVIAVALVLIILVQRPAGGGLAGAFGGAGGGGGTESVFGGRVGDALTFMTIGAFCVYLVLAITLNLLQNQTAAAPVLTPTDAVAEEVPGTDDVTLVPRDETETAAELPLLGPASTEPTDEAADETGTLTP
jgi:preprotein translocase subunit SecG